MDERREVLDPQERRLHEVVSAYLEAADAGWAPDRERLLAGYPELSQDLKAFFVAQSRVAALAYPCPSDAQRRDKAAGGDSDSDTPTSAEQRGAGSGSPSEYESLVLIKEGGMGSVYKAWQRGANRWVALKRIKAGRLATRAEVRQFRAEAEAAANLDHPHIVPIYEVGVREGQPFFSMKLFEYGSLEKHLRRFEKDSRAAARLVAIVARAVHYAHQHGILHRDLKPGNILLDAQEQPYVADFGLAKRLRASTPAVPDSEKKEQQPPKAGSSVTPDAATRGTVRSSGWADLSYLAPEQAGKGEAPDLSVKTDAGTVTADPMSRSGTREGTLVGTQGYMPPEHAGLSKEGSSTAADVYSLGAILYRLLTGKTVFPASSMEDAVRQIRESEPAPPRSLNSQIDSRLEAVCLKCLAKKPESRYASAEALAEDLDRWLNGKPPLAWEMPWPLQAMRTVRRYLYVIIATATLSIAAASAFFVYYYFNPDRIPRELEREARQGPLVLIGPTGHPRWSRWNIGEGDAVITPETDKPFSFTTLAHGRLELLPKPPGPRFRFAAEVKHDSAIDLSWVGIYFAHIQKTTANGMKHYWWDVTFADLGTIARQRQGPDPKHKYGEVALTPRRYGLPEGKLEVSTPGGRLFLSASETGKTVDWRQLAIEVTPEKIRVFWENELIRDMTPADVRKFGEPYLAKGEVFLPEIEFDPEGSLGIYVYRGKASFRNVVVMPLQ